MSRTSADVRRRKKIFDPLFPPVVRRPGPEYWFGNAKAHRRPGVIVLDELRHVETPTNKVITKKLEDTGTFREDPLVDDIL